MDATIPMVAATPMVKQPRQHWPDIVQGTEKADIVVPGAPWVGKFYGEFVGFRW